MNKLHRLGNHLNGRLHVHMIFYTHLGFKTTLYCLKQHYIKVYCSMTFILNIQVKVLLSSFH